MSEKTLETLTRAIYEQRMRAMFPFFDSKASISPRNGLGTILSYDSLPESMKIQERSVAQAALDIIRVLDDKDHLKQNTDGRSEIDPSTVTNKELIQIARFSNDPIKNLLGDRLEELETYVLNPNKLQESKDIIFKETRISWNRLLSAIHGIKISFILKFLIGSLDPKNSDDIPIILSIYASKKK